MLQRVQSVWLFFAALGAFLSVRLSFYSGNIDVPGKPRAFQHLNAGFSIWILVSTIVVICLTLIAIFLYKTRKIQLRVTLAALLFSLLNIFLYYEQSKRFVEGNYDLTAMISLAVPVLLILAARGIGRDEKLVKSLNRLR